MGPSEKIYIKNMVCPRCISAVEGLLDKMDIGHQKVVLGEVTLEKTLSKAEENNLKVNLDKLGFELLESKESKIISQIKTLIINIIHHKKGALKVNYSDWLASELHAEYSALSKLFSSVEGITIEKFITAQKTEKAKEYLFYGELTLSEIAFEMHYSSVAHLSAQFKKETGMTPTEFKRNKSNGRNTIDQLNPKGYSNSERKNPKN